eukprot:403357526
MSLFGQPQAQPTSSLFGGASLNNSNSTQSNQSKPTGLNLFGGQPSTQSQQQPQSTSLFGQNSVGQQKPTLFGSAASSHNQTKIDSSFGQQQQQPSLLAQSNQVSSATTQSTNQQPQLFGLGENSNSGNPFGNSATNIQATASAQSNTSSTIASTTSASLFSNSVSQPQQQQTVQQNTGFSIGQQTAQPATTFGNSNAQPNPTTNTGLFGSTTANNNNTATVPSGGLFGGTAINNNNGPSLFGGASNNTRTPLFNQLGQIASGSSVNSGGLFGPQGGGLFMPANANASFGQATQAQNLFSNLNQENSSLGLFQIEIKNLECLLQNSQINPYFPNNANNGNQSSQQIHITLKLLDPNNAGVVQHQVTQSIFPQFLANTDLLIDGTQINQPPSRGLFGATTNPPTLKLDVKLRQQSNEQSSLFRNTQYHNLVTSQVGLRFPQQQQQHQPNPSRPNIFSQNTGYNFNSNSCGGTSDNNTNYPLGKTDRNTTIVNEKGEFSREDRFCEFHSNPENKKSKEQQRFEDYLKQKVEQKEDRLKASSTEESKTSVPQSQPETQTLPKVNQSNTQKNSSDLLKAQEKNDGDMITVYKPAPASQNKPLPSLSLSSQLNSQQHQLSNTTSSQLLQQPQVQDQKQPQVQEQKPPQVQQQQQPQVQQLQPQVQQLQQPQVQEQKPAVQEEQKKEKKVEFNFDALNQNPPQSQQQNQQPTANAQTQQKKPMPLFGGAFDPTKQKSSSSVSSLFGNSQEEQKSSQSASQLFGQAHNPFAQISTRNVSLQPEVTTNANPFTNANKNSEGSDAPQSTGAGGFFVSAAPSQNVQGQNPAPTIQSNQAASSIFKPGATNIFGGMKK